MIGEFFYHQGIKKVISVFGSLFSDVVIKTGENKIVKVPIHFSQKQKFIEVLTHNEDVRDMYVGIALPALGFEITNFAYSPETMTNPMNVQHQIRNHDSVDFMFTSLPYTIGIELFLATNTIDEAYQIIEQILPFFTPQLTVTMTDIELHNIKTNITFDFTALSQDIQYEGPFDEQRIILFNMSFSAHTKLHSNPRSIARIKDVIIEMKEKDHMEMFDRLVGTRNENNDQFDWRNENGQN